MSLPSQNARIIGSRATVMSRRRRRRRGGRGGGGGLLRLIMVAIAAVVAWWLWPNGGSDTPSEAEIQQASIDRQGQEQGQGQPSGGGEVQPEPQRPSEPSTTLATNRRAPGSERTPEASRPTRALPPPVVIDQGRGTITGALPTQPAGRQPTTRAQPEPTRETAAASDGNFDSPRVIRLVEQADREIARADPVEARRLLSDALREPTATITDHRLLRERLTALNEDLLFGPRVAAGDPISFTYQIQRGDVLSTLVRRQKLGIDWRLITHVNQLARPERIRAGQRIKLVRGPFHAVVSKNAYRLDLYWGDPDRPAEWLFIRSFPVGLGEYDGTPLGTFVIRKDSRLVNPAWTNPRTGERFSADDPDNPIGEYWIGLDGVGPAAVHTGYGIHGTIEPDSIGGDESMGCIRMLDDDIKLLYGMLVGGDTRVVIQP